MQAGYSRLCKLSSLLSTLQISFNDHQFPSNLGGKNQSSQARKMNAALVGCASTKGKACRSHWCCQSHWLGEAVQL